MGGLASYNLWQNTAGYGSVAARVDYLDAEQNRRLERMRVSRLLWRGRHRQFYLDEGRTQFDFTQMRAGGRILQPYVTYNVLRLVTTTITDLLIGDEPLLRVEDPALQTRVDELSTRSDLHRVFYDCAKTASWGSEAMVEISRWDGEVYASDVRPDEIFPLGDRNPDGQYSQYRRFATHCVGTVTLLLESTYAPGSITRQCFELAGTAKGKQVSLSQWPTKRPDGSDLPDVEPTGIDWPTIVWMANEIDEGQPTSDYDGLIDLQDELNHKQTQIARVLAKHSDPKMAIPQSMADMDGNIRASHDVFFVRSKEEVPSYITWNAELANAMADRDFTLQALCVAAELSPVLLGIKQGATPDAARKLRLEATKSLSRAKRKGSFFRPFVRTAIDTALMLQAAALKVPFALADSSIELRDGLPIDTLDEAQALNLLTAGRQVMSIERAVEQQLQDPAAATREIARLKDEAAATAASATPGIFLNEASASAGVEPGETPELVTGGEPSPAVATNDLRASVGGSQQLLSMQTAYYAGTLPRDAATANAMLLFGFSTEEAAQLFPEKKPDAPGLEGEKSSAPPFAGRVA